MEKLPCWRKLNGQKLLRPITQEVEQVIQNELFAGHHIKLCIGTDSQVKGSITEFATVLVFIRTGNGGFMYILNEHTRQKMSIGERMLTEVDKSVQIAHDLSPLLLSLGISMEVHADINTCPGFKSYDSLKAAMGYITGMGFVFKAKPDAFASTSCANKVVQ